MPVKSQTAQFLTFFFPCPEQVSRLTPARLCSGAERARTANLLVANQALSQLSYGPRSNPLSAPSYRSWDPFQTAGPN